MRLDKFISTYKFLECKIANTSLVNLTSFQLTDSTVHPQIPKACKNLFSLLSCIRKRKDAVYEAKGTCLQCFIYSFQNELTRQSHKKKQRAWSTTYRRAKCVRAVADRLGRRYIHCLVAPHCLGTSPTLRR